MFKEFNVQFQDCEIVGGADNLLADTKVSKVVLRGDNKLSSLDSTFKNCSQLDTIDGNINLENVTDIDNMCDGSELLKNVTLENIKGEITAKDAFNNVETINIDGECTKEGIQSFLSNFEWDSRKHKYVGDMESLVAVKQQSLNGYEEGVIQIEDSMEHSTKGIQIDGQTYTNLVEGRNEQEVKDEWTLTTNNGTIDIELNNNNNADLVEIQGQTYNNLVQGLEKETLLVDEFSHKQDELGLKSFNGGFNVLIDEIQGNTYKDENMNVSSIGDFINYANAVQGESSSCGITYTCDGNRITLNGTNTEYVGYDITNAEASYQLDAYAATAENKEYYKNKRLVIGQGTYTLSAVFNNTTNTNLSLSIIYDDTKILSLQHNGNLVTGIKEIQGTITVSSHINGIFVGCWYSGYNYTGSYVENIQLEKGSVKTDYAPYGSYKVDVNCTSKNLIDISNISDVGYGTHSYSSSS